MDIDCILSSDITVWILGTIDVVLLVLAIVSIIRSERSTYNFEKMKAEYDLEYKNRTQKKKDSLF